MRRVMTSARVAVGATLALLLSACMSQEQFYGSYGEPVYTAGTLDADEGRIELRAQVLTDYDFWGETPGGIQYWWYAVNTGAEPVCGYITLDIKDRTRVRDIDHGRFLVVDPGQELSLAWVRFHNRDEAPGFWSDSPPEGEWKRGEGHACIPDPEWLDETELQRALQKLGS